ESGLRKDDAGKLVPRKIINRFTCEFNGTLAFACDLEPAISANPYFQFTVRLQESGTFRFTWIDDDGTAITADEPINGTEIRLAPLAVLLAFIAFGVGVHPASVAAQSVGVAPLALDGDASVRPWRRYHEWPQRDSAKFNTLAALASPPAPTVPHKLAGPLA